MKRKRILVVEDEAVVRRLLAEMLSEDYEVQIAGNASDALALVKASAFDLILTDLELPDMNGLDLVDQIRAQVPGQKCLVAAGNTEGQESGLRARSLEFILKPFRLTHLLAEVERVMARK